MTERAMNKENGADEIAKTYGWLMIARFFGTLLAHLLLLPSAWLISWVSRIIG
jgi:hypothetical protein